MKKLLLLTLSLFLSLQISAQEESSWWIFGDGAGVEFTPNPQNRSNSLPVTASGYDTDEGVAVISDDNGDLLFFTDGSTVWNSLGNVMVNGTGLDGNFSSTQSAIVVKAPETPGVYFIFTVGNAGGGPLSYSRVEMGLNGGLGGVVAGIKNIVLIQSCAEKVAATIKTDSNNAYVMTFAESNATAQTNGTGDFNALFTWEVRGIPGPNVSFVFPSPIPQSSNSNLGWYPVPTAATSGDRGMLRISPDGTKLVVCNQNGGFGAGASTGAFLYEFNPGNGQVSGAGLTLHTGPVYGAEFSASSQYLYHDDSSTYGFGGTKLLFQYELCDDANILSSKRPIASDSNSNLTTFGEGRSTLQLAKDGEIYVARFDQTTLGRIEGSETPTATYNQTAFDISPGQGKQGLPVFVQSDFQSFFTVSDQCQGDATDFQLACLPQVANSMWDFGDGTTLSVTGNGPVQNTYATAGTYTVMVTVENVSGDIRDFTQDITIYENGIVDPIDTTLLDYCDDDDSGSEIVDLTQFTADVLGTQDANTFDISYHPTMTDAEMDTNRLPDNYDVAVGTVQVWVRISNNNSPIDDGCSAVSSFDLTVSTTPRVSNIPDFELCDDISQDGVEDFDLAGYLPVIENTAGNPVDVAYTLYTTQNDADMAMNEIDTSVPYRSVTSNDIIYIRLQNTNDADCFGTSTLNLVVFARPNITTPADIEVCDDAPLDGSGDFNLDDLILTVDPTGVNDVTFHNSLADADADSNPLPSIYTVSGNEEIFVRSETLAGCFNTTSFNINVLAAPSIGNAPDLSNICGDNVDLDQNLFELSVQDAIILNGNNPSDFTITYYTTDADAQAGSNQLPLSYVVPFQAGVTTDLLFARLENNVTGCFNTSQFTIIFERCEIIFPEGFSPNNDGINDTFSIPGLAEQYNNFNLKVFNRNGSVVYDTSASNYEEFAGIPNTGVLSGDGLLPTGVYFYVIQYNDADIEDTASWVYINY
jgi:gliding motility-associated-like protein